MKKITLLLAFVACAVFASAQTETVYLETCGTLDVSISGDPNYRPKIELYTGWDKSSPITYSRTTTLDGYADVRKTSTTTNHIWFPSAKGSDLIISNIPAVGFKNLKLSFDVRNSRLTVNYGIEKLRFMQAVTVNSKVRVRAKLQSLVNLRGTSKAEIFAVLEIEGSKKPALEANIVFLYHFV